MGLSKVVYIIQTPKPVNDLRPENKMAFLMLVAGFNFSGHLSNSTIHDLREQSTNLVPWNMPNWSLFERTVWFGSFCWIFTKDVRKLEVTLVCPGITQATLCKRHCLLMLNGCRFVKIKPLQVLVTIWLNYTIYKYVWMKKPWNVYFATDWYLIFLENHSFELSSSFPMTDFLF